MGGPRPMMMMGHPAMMGGRVVMIPSMRGGPRPIMLPPPMMMRGGIPVRRVTRSVNPATSATTKKRVGKITLYHLTSISAGKAIKKSGKMLSWISGWFGGGIYFAKSVAICAKSKNGTDCVIKAEVNMGKALVINANTCKTTYIH